MPPPDLPESRCAGPDDAAPPGDRLLADAVACAGDPVVTVDLDDTVTSWNAAAQALLGWRPEDVVGRPGRSLLPDGVDVSRDSGLVEVELLHREGHRVPVSLRIAPLHDRQGVRVGRVTVARDLRPELLLREELERARQQAQSSFAHSVLAQATVDADGLLSAVNPALCALSGYTPEQLLGRPYQDFVLWEQLDPVAERWSLVERGRRDVERRVRRLRRADGSVVETLVSTLRVPARDGSPARAELAVEDLTAVLAAERAVQASEARWRSLALHSADVAFLVDVEGTVLFVTPSVAQHFGYDEADLVGRSAFDLVHPDDVTGMRAGWELVVQADAGPVTARSRFRHAGGTWRWVEQTATNRLDEADVCAVVVNVTDVTHVLAAEEQLALLSETDQLTGLLGRRAVLARLEQALHERPGAQTALVVADLDGFARVNAVHGHAAGDEVLTTVSERLGGIARRSEALGRIAGDRFALVLTALEGEATLEEAVSRLAGVLQRPVRLRGQDVPVTATVVAVRGAAAEPGVVVDSAALVDAAEALLTAARRDGAGQVRVQAAVSPSKMVAEAAVLDELRRALLHGQLVVHYQPVIDLRSGRPRGVEALVRWQHPERGLLLPDAFIQAAEDSGQIVALGEQVLQQACRAAQRWAAGEGGPDFTVAVNLSARQISAPDVVATVQRALEAAGCASRNLVLEVTESAVMADVDAARTTLEELRGLGVALSVDDFGTGYSSLTYLKHFPVNTLKVDRSFVRGLGQDADDTAIVTSVVRLAATIGLDCVAEGVETAEQARALLELGCGSGQGFVWSRALSVEQLDAWLRDRPHPLRLSGARSPVLRPRVAARPLDAGVLRRIAEMQQEGASLHTIAAALNTEGVHTGEGKRWHARSVARVVQSLLQD